MATQDTKQFFSEATGVSGYAGDVTPRQAWDILAETSNAVLIDVRTNAEWIFVGTPDLTQLGKEVLHISWRIFPSFGLNPDFSAALLAENISKDAPLLFICRSGGRSRDAAIAATGLGYHNCFNIENGFEGEPDAYGHRGTLSGWKQSGLPWGQK